MRLQLALPTCITLLASVGHAQWSENFDSLTTGSITGQAGWQAWTATADGHVDTAFARSAPNSIRIGQNAGALETDAVQQYYDSSTASNPQYTSGIWVYKCYQYIPSTMTGTTYFILMADWDTAGPYEWAVQVAFTATGVSADAGGTTGTATTITDQWVELRVHCDLDHDTAEFFYNGSQVGPTYQWTGGVFGGGAQHAWLSAVDLYANDATDCWYDDFEVYPLSVEQHNPGCPSSVGPIGLNVLLPPSLAAGAYAFEYTNLPQPFAFNSYGTSKEDYLGIPLPVDLSILGAPGCQWHVSLDFSEVLISATPAPGPYTALSTLVIPSNPIFLGVRFYHQAFASDPVQNPLELVSTPAYSFVVGM